LHWPTRPLPEIRTENRYVFFTTGGLDCAVPLGQVLEIGQPHAVTPVPNVPDWVVGVANVRGDIVSIVDLGRFLDVAPASGPRGPVLLVRAQREELTTGLVVERVRGIRTVARDQVHPALPVPGRVAAWASGMTEFDARPVVVLDLENLLLSSEMRL
jgi:chemotaxis signal transduction protein